MNCCSICHWSSQWQFLWRWSWPKSEGQDLDPQGQCLDYEAKVVDPKVKAKTSKHLVRAEIKIDNSTARFAWLRAGCNHTCSMAASARQCSHFSAVKTGNWQSVAQYQTHLNLSLYAIYSAFGIFILLVVWLNSYYAFIAACLHLIWYVMLVWRKGNINRLVSVLRYCVPL